MAQEKGGKLSKTEQKQALGKSFGICRSDLVGKCDDCKKEKSLFYKKICKECYQKREKNYVKKYDMNQAKLKKAIDKLEAEMKEKGITGSEERETYYRAHLMPYFSTATIRTKEQDLQNDILQEQLKNFKITQDYLREKLNRLQKALKNVDPKTRAVILEEIEKIKKQIEAKSQYRNYSRSVKYEDSIAGGIREKLKEKLLKEHRKQLKETMEILIQERENRESYDGTPELSEVSNEAIHENIVILKEKLQIGEGIIVEDYPVSGHTRSGKPVKAHARGESERKLGNYAKSQKYPGKLIRIVKGKVYIEYKPFSHQQGRGTAKAIRVGGVWIPKSQVWYDSFGKGGDIYVSEWFYPKLERKEAEATLQSVEKEIIDDREEIAKLRRMTEELKTDRFTSLKPGHYDDRIKDYEKYLAGALKQKEEIVKWFEEHPEEDFATEDASVIGGIKQKLAEKKERSIFFRAYRPLETLREVTKTRGKLSSSNVVGMEYNDNMLKVTFNWEGLGEVEYGYDVGPDFYNRMAKAQSKGKFVWSELRGKSPGYVIDDPTRTTPGGVGGSKVPYTKLTKQFARPGRQVEKKEYKKLQKFYSKQLGGKVKIVAHMPFVRKKQKILSRESKAFKKKDLVPDGELVLIKIATLSDAIPVKGHWRNLGGKKVWIEESTRAGEKKAEAIKKFKAKGKTEIPKSKKSRMEKTEKRYKKWVEERHGKKPEEAEKKPSAKKRAVSPEEKRRREIDKQARGQKATPAPEPREEAIQKLIEQTGMERKEAEKQIAKLMGLTPEQAKKKAEDKQREETFKEKNIELAGKLLILKQINAKIQSSALDNLLKMLKRGFILLATGKDAKTVLRSYKKYYDQLKKEKKLTFQNKSKLLIQIDKIHKELESLSKSDFIREDARLFITAAVDACANRRSVKHSIPYNQAVEDCIKFIAISKKLSAKKKAEKKPERKEPPPDWKKEWGKQEEKQTALEKAKKKAEALKKKMAKEKEEQQKRRAKAKERKEAFEKEQAELREKKLTEQNAQAELKKEMAELEEKAGKKDAEGNSLLSEEEWEKLMKEHDQLRQYYLKRFGSKYPGDFPAWMQSKELDPDEKNKMVFGMTEQEAKDYINGEYEKRVDRFKNEIAYNKKSNIERKKEIKNLEELIEDPNQDKYDKYRWKSKIKTIKKQNTAANRENRSMNFILKNELLLPPNIKLRKNTAFAGSGKNVPGRQEHLFRVVGDWKDIPKQHFAKIMKNGITLEFGDRMRSTAYFSPRTQGDYQGYLGFTTSKYAKDNGMGASYLSHEVGHTVYYDLAHHAKEVYKEWEALFSETKEAMFNYGNTYYSVSTEMFAETYAEYYSGRVMDKIVGTNFDTYTGDATEYSKGGINKKRQKGESWEAYDRTPHYGGGGLGWLFGGKKVTFDLLDFTKPENQIPKNVNPNEWGLLDDFPKIAKFYEKHFGPSKKWKPYKER